MKFFTKSEIIILVILSILLVGISWPNFALSLRRARDQVRRDDLGQIEDALGQFFIAHGYFPDSSKNGEIVACNRKINSAGKVVMSPCPWGKVAWIDEDPKVNKKYMETIPGDPNANSGVSYMYFSDGGKYQLMAFLEGADEAGYDPKLITRGVMCGNKICNIGRAYHVPLYISIEEYDLQIYCSKFPKDVKCIK